MQPVHRLIVLYIVLGAAVVNIVVVLAKGQPVPPEVWGLLGAVVGYVLVRERGGDGKPPQDGPP